MATGTRPINGRATSLPDSTSRYTSQNGHGTAWLDPLPSTLRSSFIQRTRLMVDATSRCWNGTKSTDRNEGRRRRRRRIFWAGASAAPARRRWPSAPRAPAPSAECSTSVVRSGRRKRKRNQSINQSKTSGRAATNKSNSFINTPTTSFFFQVLLSNVNNHGTRLNIELQYSVK